MYKFTFENEALRILNRNPRMRRTCESYIDSIVHDDHVPPYVGSTWLDEHGPSDLLDSVLFVTLQLIAGTRYINIVESINHRGA